MNRNLCVGLIGIVAWGMGWSAHGSDIQEAIVWRSGEDGYHTYRIPSLIVTHRGTVLAFCEGRKTSSSDHGDVDLLFKRSVDGGVTWSRQQLVHEEGGTASITIGNPCPVVDRKNGIIWLLFTRDNRAVLVTSSRDDGVTWSAPVDISKSVMADRWSWVATGPGNGIQLSQGSHAGRLLIPSDHRVTLDGDETELNSHMIYSDDGGQSWKISQPIQVGGNECQVVERSDGTLLVNIRMQGDFRGWRGIATSSDGGESWTRIEHDSNLPCPKCQASILRLRSGELLFCNPNPGRTGDGQASGKRIDLTLRISQDDGASWHRSRILRQGPCAYSCLAEGEDGTILCLYETGKTSYRETLTLARIPRKSLIEATKPAP